MSACPGQMPRLNDRMDYFRLYAIASMWKTELQQADTLIGCWSKVVCSANVPGVTLARNLKVCDLDRHKDCNQLWPDCDEMTHSVHFAMQFPQQRDSTVYDCVYLIEWLADHGRGPGHSNGHSDIHCHGHVHSGSCVHFRV